MHCRTTEEKISRALAYYGQYAHRLESDGPFNQLLSRFLQAIQTSTETMRRLGIAGRCAECASNGPGSCCSRGVEDWYDAMLLFVNLLLGCDLREVRPQSADCHFVGPNGCTLVARQYFCVHYLCPAISDQIGPATTAELLAVVGKELQLGWEVEQYLYRVIDRQHSTGG